MALRETLYFLQQFRHSVASVGAVLPTSQAAAQAMASEFARRAGPRRVLEAGPGTGSITAEIIRHLRPGDHLVLCELNTDFVTFLKQRFEHDPDFRRVRDQVTILHQDVTSLDPTDRFDFIISAIPFTNLPAPVVEAIFASYRTMLKPDGVLSFIEYAYLRALKRLFLPEAASRQAEIIDRIVNQHVAPNLFRRDLVVRNVPPAWIRHLRFQEPQPNDGLPLAPLTHNRRIALGASAGLSTEVVPFLAGLLPLLWILRRHRSVQLVVGLLTAGVAAFFRDPFRPVRLDPSVAYAAADGRVLAVEQVRDARFGVGNGEWWRIAVFLSITDVHINRSPIAGKVLRVIPESGGYAIASLSAAEHNNSEYTVIAGARGPCVVAQRSGILARRIVNWCHPGQLLAQGERYGLIRFGSRTDIYLPANQVTPCVSVGDRVIGGLTIVARYTDGESKLPGPDTDR